MKETTKDNLARFAIGVFVFACGFIVGASFVEDPVGTGALVALAAIVTILPWAAFRIGNGNL